jgi:hypothetical protein
MAPHRSVLLAAVAALVLLAPASQGAYAFGTIVDKNDYDFQQAPAIRGTTPTAGKWIVPCFADEDGSGTPNGQDSIYLGVMNGLADGCGVNTNTKNVRLSTVGSFAAGTDVKATDADNNVVLGQLGTAGAPGHAIRVLNIDPAATVRKADTVYLDLTGLGASTVSIGDLRLSPFGDHKAGTRVANGDADLNFPLIEFNGGATKTFYTPNMVFEFGKGWYLNADVDALAGGAVEEGDVRLTSGVPNPMADALASVANPGPVGDGLTFSNKTVKPGEVFQVYVQVRNPTTKVGSALVKTSLDGVLVDARGTPTLVQNEVQTLVISLIAPSEPGKHKVTSADYSGYFDVSAPAAPPTPTTTQPTATTAPAVVETTSVVKQSAPGVTPIAVLGMLVLALVALRRRVD